MLSVGVIFSSVDCHILLRLDFCEPSYGIELIARKSSTVRWFRAGLCSATLSRAAGLHIARQLNKHTHATCLPLALFPQLLPSDWTEQHAATTLAFHVSTKSNWHTHGSVHALIRASSSSILPRRKVSSRPRYPQLSPKINALIPAIAFASPSPKRKGEINFWPRLGNRRRIHSMFINCAEAPFACMGFALALTVPSSLVSSTVRPPLSRFMHHYTGCGGGSHMFWGNRLYPECGVRLQF